MKESKRIVSVLLVLLLLLTAAPLSNLAEIIFSSFFIWSKAVACRQGDIVQFGRYPQSEVKDTALISQLNAKAGDPLGWVSYNYYANGKQSDFMKYLDITFGIDIYRGVYFTQYRPPYGTTSSPTGYNTIQGRHGYTTNTIYWFKYEPLNWIVLDPNEGIVLCQNLIDSQPFYYTVSSANNHYANDFSQSDIRKWLNSEFYYTAFNTAERNNIITRYNTSGSCSIEDVDEYTKYFNTSDDNVWLLSLSEVLDSANNFEEITSRRVDVTDYAKAQGLYVYQPSIFYSSTSNWFLRSPSYNPNIVDVVKYYGDLASHIYVDDTSVGIRPALLLSSLMVQDDNERVRLEFRYADTKTLLNNEHTATVFSGDGSFLGKTDTGILFVDKACFPLQGLSLSITKDEDESTAYSFSTDIILNADAGSTIVLYVSSVEEECSIAVKTVTAEKKKNYGSPEIVESAEESIRTATKELEQAINGYLSLFETKENKSNKTSKTTSQLIESARCIYNAKVKNKIYSIPIDKKHEIPLCYALASVFSDETEESIDLGKININKPIEQIALDLTKHLVSNFSDIEKTVAYEKYKVKVSISKIGKAFTGSYTIYDKKGLYLESGIVNSSVDEAMDTMLEYYLSISDLVNDMLKNSMASIYNTLADVTGFNEFVESELSQTVLNAMSYLEKSGYGKVKDLLFTGKEIYLNIKDISFASSDISVENILNTEEKVRNLYEIIYNHSFTSAKANKAAAKEAISLMNTARSKLYNALYFKLYGTTKDETGFFKQIGNWIHTKILCPVDVEVYNADGNLIAYVDTLGRHEEYIYCSDDVYIEVDGDETFIYYPEDKEVTIFFIGTDDGTMDYSLERIEEGMSVERLNYYAVPIYAGVGFDQTIPASPDLSALTATLALSGEEEIYPNEYLSNQDETAHVRTLYSATEGGNASGAMYYPKGDCAVLYAFPEEGYVFEGWFANDNCVSTEEVYRFAATKDVILQARFKIKEADVAESDPVSLESLVISEKELTLTKGEQAEILYIAVPSKAEVNVQWRSSNPVVVSVDGNGIVSANMEGEAEIYAYDNSRGISSVACHVIVEKVDVVPHAHTYTSAVTTPATCTEPGVMTYTCVDGDDTYTEPIPALGHIDEDNDGKCDREGCGEMMTGGDHCPQCGKIHNGGFFDSIVGFFHKIIYRLTHLFG